MKAILIISLWTIINCNCTAQIQFQKTIGGIGNDYAISVIQTLDEGYIFGGYTDSYGAGGDDFYIVKLEQNGGI